MGSFKAGRLDPFPELARNYRVREFLCDQIREIPGLLLPRVSGVRL